MKQQRIELCPSTDQWMMGDRFGTIVNDRIRDGKTQYRVRLDVSNRLIWVHEDHVGKRL